MSLYKSVSEYHLLPLGYYIHFKLQHSSFTMVIISFYAWILDSVTMNNSMTNDFDNMKCLNWFIIKFYDNILFAVTLIEKLLMQNSLQCFSFKNYMLIDFAITNT